MADILVIDDDITTQLILQTALADEGHQVTAVDDGLLGLQRAKELQPDLIICDWMMPHMDGITLCKILKSTPELATTFFILLSAREELDDRIAGLDAGADEFLAKPIELQELLARVRAGLRIKQLSRQLSHSNQTLQQAMHDLQQAQAMLIQREKMSGLEQMVAGIAHEINNPVTFIDGNLNYVQTYTQDLLELLQSYQQEYPHPSPTLQAKQEAIDLAFLEVDMPKLLGSIKAGARRIQHIVQSLRSFSRLDEAEIKQVDLHQGLESVLLTLRHRLQETGISVVRDYGDLALVECYARELNQVFFNILNNAIDAIKDHQPFGAGEIQIQTRVNAGDRPSVSIYIRDNGCGIEPSIQSRIFDPFFTTKPVGQGTGLGLATSYQIVVQQHQGNLSHRSTPGQGTTFQIEVPIEKSQQAILNSLPPTQSSLALPI